MAETCDLSLNQPSIEPRGKSVVTDQQPEIKNTKRKQISPLNEATGVTLNSYRKKIFQRGQILTGSIRWLVLLNCILLRMRHFMIRIRMSTTFSQKVGNKWLMCTTTPLSMAVAEITYHFHSLMKMVFRCP